MGVRARAEALDLASRDLVTDPYPVYARVRSLGPVFRVERWGCYAVTSRETCVRVLGDDERFDAFGQQVLRRLQADVLNGATSWHDPGIQPPPWNGSKAQRLEGRRTTGRALGSRAVGDLWPRFEADCRDAARRLAERSGSGPVDLVRDYAIPLVTGFLAGLMAITPDGREAFQTWVETGYDDSAEPAADASRRLWRALSRQALDRLRHPADDFLGHLVANPGAHRTDTSPVAAHLDFVVSTSLMISRVTHQGLVLSFSTLMNALMEHPDQYAVLRRRRELLPGAVEEGLRFDSSTQALGRLAREDVELGAVTVPAGSLLIVFAGAAGRDGTVWELPDRFDITRGVSDSARHLAFGLGSSSCLGGGMSRRLLGHLLGALADRFDRIAPAPGRRHFPEFATRGLVRLPAAAGEPPHTKELMDVDPA